jgi:hypothetical protein
MLVLAGKADWLLPSCRGWSLTPRRSNSAGATEGREQQQGFLQQNLQYGYKRTQMGLVADA